VKTETAKFTGNQSY